MSDDQYSSSSSEFEEPTNYNQQVYTSDDDDNDNFTTDIKTLHKHSSDSDNSDFDNANIYNDKVLNTITIKSMRNDKNDSDTTMDDMSAFESDASTSIDKYFLSHSNFDDSRFNSEVSINSAISCASRIRGGLKVSKKQVHDQLYLQRLIDKDLREKIPIDAFKQEKIVTMIKNTVGIKCKACGSENVYVESKQVRSADEAMTKFYTCLDCGNQWRFD